MQLNLLSFRYVRRENETAIGFCSECLGSIALNADYGAGDCPSGFILHHAANLRRFVGQELNGGGRVIVIGQMNFGAPA